MTVKELIERLQHHKPDDILVGDIFCYLAIINIGKYIEVEITEEQARKLAEYMEDWDDVNVQTIQDEILYMEKKGWIFDEEI